METKTMVPENVKLAARSIKPQPHTIFGNRNQNQTDTTPTIKENMRIEVLKNRVSHAVTVEETADAFSAAVPLCLVRENRFQSDSPSKSDKCNLDCAFKLELSEIAKIDGFGYSQNIQATRILVTCLSGFWPYNSGKSSGDTKEKSLGVNNSSLN